MPVSVRIKPGGYILLAFLILTVSVQWILAALFAACIHELCHVLMICLCGGLVSSITIGASGAKIHTSPLSLSQEFLCALAGPCGSLLLLFFLRWIPRVALCGLVQGMFNLLPVYPLDGGRVFRCVRQWIRCGIGKIPCKEAKHKVQ